MEVSQFRSHREASRALGVDYSTISKVVKGKLKQTGGYWFTEDNGNGVEADKDKLRKIKADMNFKGGVFAINLKTQEALRFESQSKASRKLGVNIGNINSVIKGKLKTAGGYWFVMDDGHAVDTVKSKLHDIGKTGLKI